jgi:uncharacterized protein YcfL
MKNIIIATLCAILLSSCSTDTIDQHYTQVGSANGISITDMRSQVQNKLLVAQVTFHNSKSKPVTGYYRCQFQDSNGMFVGSTQVWQPVTIYPNEDQVIKCMATQVEATNFKAEFSPDGQNVAVTKTA